jgi:dTDP-glucose pyrophosphorylase
VCVKRTNQRGRQGGVRHVRSTTVTRFTTSVTSAVIYLGEYEFSNAGDLLIQSGWTIDAIGLDGWHINVGFPKNRDEAEKRLKNGSGVGMETVESSD